jgi:diguanylate cyclase (GGDEF)-like protein
MMLREARAKIRVANVLDLESETSAKSRSNLWRWLTVAVVVLCVGSVSTVVAANSIADRAANDARDRFSSASAQISSSLQMAIKQEEDLAVAASGFIAGSPNASNAEFAHWANSVHALSRYPELFGLGQVVIVPAAQLPAFEARALADPTGLPDAGGAFEVVPPGTRSQYCLLANALSRNSTLVFPAGYDYCTGDLGQAGLVARDSAEGAYLPISSGTFTALVVMTPVYQAGVVPTTVAGRQAAFLGWVGMSVVPEVVLQRALIGHPRLAVRMSYHDASSNASFESGKIATGARSIPTDLNNGWTVETYGALASASVFSDSSALALLIAGLLASLLLAALLSVLATGRIRALTLVRARTNQLRHQALHDALTGLPNRTLILDRIEQLLARNVRNGTLGAALYVDLDGFKNVNDTFGHGTGDRLLQAVAARLTASLRDVDTIGRMGGDEFVVLVDGTDLGVAPALVAERLLEVIRQPFVIDGSASPIAVTASVGIASGYGQTPDELLREADMALYEAKASGKNCHETFGARMGNDTLRRYELEFDLRLALDLNQFHLVYQPIYDLNDLSLVGVEALIRWQHPTLGALQPDEFIPLLESSGEIVEVGRWVLNEACAQVATWRAQGHDLGVAVNVSGRQLDREGIVDHVREALLASGLEPATLTLEVTETALMRNIDTTARRLRDLKALGVRIAIDDFGTGYSSLAYLQRFPVDCLKIDKSFTDTIGRSRESDSLIRTLLQLSSDLGLTTIAEGVETDLQVQYLRGENVDAVQGYLFARPLAPEALEAEWRERRLMPPTGRVSPGGRAYSPLA